MILLGAAAVAAAYPCGAAVAAATAAASAIVHVFCAWLFKNLFGYLFSWLVI